MYLTLHLEDVHNGAEKSACIDLVGSDSENSICVKVKKFFFISMLVLCFFAASVVARCYMLALDFLTMFRLNL